MIDWKDKTRPIKTAGGEEVEIFAEVDGVYWGRQRTRSSPSWFSATFDVHGSCLTQEPKTIEYVQRVHIYDLYFLEAEVGLPSTALAADVPVTVTIKGRKGVIHGEFEVKDKP